MDSGELATLSRSCRAPEVQRLGYLLDVGDMSRLADPLAAALRVRRHRPVLVVPGGEYQGSVDRRRVILNEPVEVDL